MSWRDLISAEESLVLPWVGGSRLRVGERVWTLEGRRPQEHCWGTFLCKTNRTATFVNPSGHQRESLGFTEVGYLVGNRLVRDDVRVDPSPFHIADQSEEVFLLEPGMERFARVSAGRLFEGGPLIFKSQEFPLGPEDEVFECFLDDAPIFGLKGISPALEAAFRMEVYQREVAQRRRAELEELRRQRVIEQEKEARRQQLQKQLGDGSIRRELARHDFEAAARASLTVGGATYLDHRRSTQAHEMVVTFRLNNRRFECTCDDRTLRIIDAGICLKAENDEDGFDSGTKGDTWFTLESLPMVIMEATREDKLVIFRHVS